LDALTEKEAEQQPLAVCGSRRWVSAMQKARPFDSLSALHARAQDAWRNLPREDWLEAFAAHPRIGDAPGDSDRRGAAWPRAEQRGMTATTDATRTRFIDLNRRYEQRFGYIFIICATGRSADEMLHALDARLSHSPEEELPIAVAEQAAIIRLRIERLVVAPNGSL
jgi:allantoicase